MKQQTYTQKEISIMFNKSLSLLAHYKKELIEKGYMYKNEKGKNIINAEGAEYLRQRFAEIDQSKIKNVKKDKIILEQEVKALQKEKEWYKDKLEDYKNQAEDWKKQAEIWKDEKNKEQKDKEVWREIALKKENLLIERQKNSSLSSNEKPNIFKKFNKR
jgi:predicted metal-dependent phosphoesterase TrpH